MPAWEQLYFPRPSHSPPLPLPPFPPFFDLIFQDILLQAERNRAVTQARVFDFKIRLFQYVYIISTMSSEKHLEGDTGELSESEALLGYARSTTVLPEPRSPTLDRLAGHCPRDLSAITKRLKELADQNGAYKLKCREKISMVWSCAVMVLGAGVSGGTWRRTKVASVMALGSRRPWG